MNRCLFRGGLVSLLALLAPACGSDESPIATSTIVDADGAVSSGGRSGSGGSRTGGVTGSGGSNAGGSGGSNTGGVSGAGGVASGGISNDAGVDGSSGAGGAGGATGGGSSSGGTNTGGAIGTGGTNTGGAIGTGGANTGGAIGTGGTAGSGGASTGGTPGDAGPTGDIFVNPATGDDNRSGFSSANAVKTILKAAQISSATPGLETIHLENGTYDYSTQTGVLVSFSPGTIVRGESPGGVTVLGSLPLYGFAFSGGGELHDVTFDTFAQAVQASGSPSTFSMSGVHFRNVTQPMLFLGSVVATVDASGPGTFVVPRTTGFGYSCLVAGDDSNVTFSGGVFQNVPGTDSQVFLARERAKLTIDATVIDTSSVRAITIYDNADVVLTNSQIHGVSVASTGLTVSTIFMGSLGTLNPLDQTLEVVNTDITMNQASGIGMQLYGGMASKPIIKITSSHIENNAGNGLGAGTSQTLDANLVNTIQAIDSTFKGNTLAGIIAPVGTISITGGEVSGNGGNGIGLTGGNYVNSLKVRGTKIDDNGGHGISFAAVNGSSLDLGRNADPGGITFTNVDAAHSAVSLQGLLQGYAVGNTWIPNVQGASAAGAYTSPTTIVGLTSGLNAFVVAGGRLVVAE